MAPWFPASTRPRSLEGTGRQGSDLLTHGQKPVKFLKLLNPYFEKRLSVAYLQSFFRVNLIVLYKFNSYFRSFPALPAISATLQFQQLVITASRCLYSSIYVLSLIVILLVRVDRAETA